MWLLILAGFIVAFIFRFWAKRRQEATGQQAPVFLVGLGLVIVPAALYILIAGFPFTFDLPQRGRFNLTGGLEVAPEFAALLFGLSIYTAASSPKWCAPAFSPSRAGRPKRPMRSAHSPASRCGSSCCRRRCG